jgi:outer membrane protein OmpA-like peptidoglycan-associated protein
MKHWIAIVIILLGINEINAKDNPTNWTITGSAGLAGNLHSAAFAELPGLPTCCTEFTGGFGIGYFAAAGAEYKLENGLFGWEASVFARAGLANISADLVEEEFIGHVISGDNARKGIVEYRIYPSLGTIFAEPGIKLRPMDNLPVDLKLGLRVGVINQKDFESEEALTNPADVTFENGSRYRRQRSGELPEATSVYAAISLGAEMEAYRVGNWSIRPEILFSYGLTDIISSRDWKAHSIRGGVNIAYIIPEAPEPPPAKSPLPGMPPPPAPPAIHPIAVDIALMSDGKRIAPGDTVFVTADYKYNIKTIPVRPVIYFGKNEARPPEYSIDFLGSKISQKDILPVAVDYLSKNNEKVKILAEATSEEKPGTARKRAEKIADYFDSRGIARGRIDIETAIADTSGFPHKELADEHRAARLIIGKQGRTFDYIASSTSTRSLRKKDITAKVDFQSKATLQKIATKAYIAEKNIYTDFITHNVIPISPHLPESIRQGETLPLLVETFAINADLRTDTANVSAYIAVRPGSRDTSANAEKRGNVFVLGFFEFDRSEFSSVNQSALRKARKAVSSGRQIELIGLTDSLGGESYNRNLARKRTAAAAAMIGGESAKLEYSYPARSYFTNSNPLGRQYNRSVLIKIK